MSDFTEEQLRDFAFDSLDDPELARRMGDDLIARPDGQVAQYLKGIEAAAEQSLDCLPGKRHASISQSTGESSGHPESGPPSRRRGTRLVVVGGLLACVIGISFWQWVRFEHAAADIDRACKLLVEGTTPTYEPQDADVLGLRQQKCRDAMELFAAMYGKQHVAYRSALEGLIENCRMAGDSSDDVRDALQELCDLDRAMHGETDERYLTSLNRLAWFEQQNGDADSAIRLFRTVIAASPQTIGLHSAALEGLAESQISVEKYGDAAQTYEAIFGLEGTAYENGFSFVKVADLWSRAGNQKMQRQYLEKGVTSMMAAKPGQRYFSVSALETLGRIYRKEGSYERAAQLYRDALVAFEQEPVSTRIYADFLVFLAETLLSLGEYDEQRALAMQALAVSETLGISDRLYVQSLKQVARSNALLGEFDVASAYMERSINACMQMAEPDQILLSELHRFQSYNAISLGKTDDAITEARQAVSVAEEADAEDPVFLALGHKALALALLETNDLTGAEREYEITHALLATMHEQDYQLESSTLALIGVLAAMREDYAKAEDSFKRAIAMIPDSDPSRILVQNSLVTVYLVVERTEDAQMLAMRIDGAVEKLIPAKVREGREGQIITVNELPIWMRPT